MFKEGVDGESLRVLVKHTKALSYSNELILTTTLDSLKRSYTNVIKSISSVTLVLLVWLIGVGYIYSISLDITIFLCFITIVIPLALILHLRKKYKMFELELKEVLMDAEI